ncbi:type II secretion system protein [Idiomarina abyssalis]|uniref:type II secretion system protein n=1 Tax=Idiomarina abyssalis TaxID=86102 RepID=UPI001CD6D30A|nr:type II secretion system protein [Idiomarina abyssalis]
MRHNNPLNPMHRQRGNTLVIAVFVIVVLGGLVAALASLLRTSSESVVIEVLGARSYLAAQSGLEQAMMEVYPLRENDEESTVKTDCDLIIQNASFSIGELQGSLGQCSATIRCDSATYTDDSNTTYTHLVLTSSAVCEAGAQRASRELQIETRVEN